MKVAIVLKMIYYIAHMYIQQCMGGDRSRCMYVYIQYLPN